MEDHEEMNKLVVCTLTTSQPITAREIYRQITKDHANITRQYSFRAMCRLMPTFKEIRTETEGKKVIYKLK
jgi:hypothetical protein